MATATIQLTGICSGGNHLTFQLSGASSRQIVVDLALLQESIDERDAESFIKVLVKLAKVGRTLNQARTLLQTGVTVTV